MADHQHRLQNIRGHLKDAHDELHALPAGEREGYEDGLARLDEVIAHAGAALDAADARLISTSAFTSIQSAAAGIANDPRVALERADAYADALIDAVALLPADVRNALRDDLAAEAERLRALRADVDEWTARLRQQIETQAAVDGKLAEAERTIATQCRALDEHMARQSETFAESQREKAAEFQAELDGFRTELAQVQRQALDEVEEHVAEIRRMERESATLLGTIGLAETADLQRQQGRRQRRAAEILRGLAVLAALGAVALALIGTTGTEPTAEALIAQLFASVLLAGLAAYLGRQSARHRAREEEACALQLELAAFSSFTEALTPEQREEERVIMTRKLFGTTSSLEPSGAPAPLSYLLQRRRAEVVPDEPDREGWPLGSASRLQHAEGALERSGSAAGSNGSAAA